MTSARPPMLFAQVVVQQVLMFSSIVLQSFNPTHIHQHPYGWLGLCFLRQSTCVITTRKVYTLTYTLMLRTMICAAYGGIASCLVQAVEAFESALKRLTDAGAELVKFDMGLLSAEGAEVEAELLLAYEAPREIARCSAYFAVKLDVTLTRSHLD